MSAIAGDVAVEGGATAEASVLLAALDFVVAEREAGWTGEGCTLVAKRLEIEARDRTAPLLVPDAGGVVVAIEGHLYNRPELADAVGLPRASEDEILVAAAWKKWGDGFPARLNGEFALAVWDCRRRRLLLAGDHVATVPLYYACVDGGRVVFGTELEPILAATGRPAEPDWEKIADYLAHANGKEDRTFVAGIAAVPPGGAVIVGEGRAKPYRYWDYATVDVARIRDVDAGIEAFRAAFERSVVRRRVVGRPTACHLTGGLDSSSIAAVAARQRGEEPAGLHLYSVVPWRPGEGEASGDVAYIPAFLGMYPDCPHTYVLGRGEPDYPLPGLSNGPVHLELTAAVKEITTLAREAGCRTLLSGSGGEAAATCLGFGVPWTAFRQGYWRWLGREILAGASTWRGRAIWCRRRIFGERRLTTWREDAARWKAMRRVLQPEFLAKHAMRERCFERQRLAGDPVLEGQLQQLHGLQQRGRLRSWAHQGRAEGLRYRHPCLDRELMELVRGLPAPVHLERGRNRELIRKAIGPWLSPEISGRESRLGPLVSAAEIDAQSAEPWTERVQSIWPAIREIVLGDADDFARLRRSDIPSQRPIADRLVENNLVAIGGFLSHLHARHARTSR